MSIPVLAILGNVFSNVRYAYKMITTYAGSAPSSPYLEKVSGASQYQCGH